MLPGHLSAASAPAAVYISSVIWLKAPVPFSKCVLLSSEDLECVPLFKEVSTVSPSSGSLLLLADANVIYERIWLLLKMKTKSFMQHPVLTVCGFLVS